MLRYSKASWLAAIATSIVMVTEFSGGPIPNFKILTDSPPGYSLEDCQKAAVALQERRNEKYEKSGKKERVRMWCVVKT